MSDEAKRKLQEATDYKVMNIKECLDALGWTYDDNKEEESYDNIQCSCGGELEFKGFFGTEVIECKKCGKHMVDLFSPIPTAPGACMIISPKDYEMDENRHWIAIDNDGGIKVAEEQSHDGN